MMPGKRKFNYSENAEYQKQYQKTLKRMLLSFNPKNPEDMQIWEHIQNKGSKARIPYIKRLIREDMEKE